jgi:hypothetical protein
MNAARLGLRPSAVALTQSGLVVARAGRRSRGARRPPRQPRAAANSGTARAVPGGTVVRRAGGAGDAGFALTEVDMAAVMGIDSDDDRR